jgi:hypothetical protein
MHSLLPAVAETSLPSRWLAMDVSSDSDIPAFRRHVTMFITMCRCVLDLKCTETLWYSLIILSPAVQGGEARGTYADAVGAVMRK